MKGKSASKPPDRKIIFTFDEKSSELLERVQRQFGAESVAETITLVLALTSGLQEQALQGYCEIVARNPKNGSERVMKDSRLLVGNLPQRKN